MKGKKIAIMGFFIALIIMSTFSVMAMPKERGQFMDDHPGVAYGEYSQTERSINYLIEEHDLTEESTIAELLDVIQNYKDNLETDAMENQGVETMEELKEAMAEDKIEMLREELGMDESATAEEVMEEAHAQRTDLMIDILDLDESATDEEVRNAMNEWKEENKHLFKQKWRFNFFGLF